MTIDNDIFLLKKIKEESDENAFKIIFEKHYRTLYNYARYNINDESACHDIVQDVFTYFWEKRNEINIKQTVKAYLLSAVHNTSINYLKKQDTNKRHITGFFHEASREQDGYDPIFESALIESLDKIISDLPDQCREIFHLSRMKGLKHKEIANILNISPRTVETQIYRALRTIKSKLK